MVFSQYLWTILFDCGFKWLRFGFEDRRPVFALEACGLALRPTRIWLEFLYFWGRLNPLVSIYQFLITYVFAIRSCQPRFSFVKATHKNPRKSGTADIILKEFLLRDLLREILSPFLLTTLILNKRFPNVPFIAEASNMVQYTNQNINDESLTVLRSE